LADITPETWVADTLRDTKVPGVAIGVSDNGGTRIASGGKRALRDTAAVTDTDLWHIGSITKSLTATLVARLVEAGQVNWDDTIGAVLSDKVEVHPDLQNITYQELLTHQSGIRANMSMLGSRRLSGMLADRDMMADRLHYAQDVLAKPDGAKGEFLYSNAGYVVAGTMLQQSTGKTWESLMQTHVFDPLGLQSAGFGPPGSVDVVDQPRGHQGWFTRAIALGPKADNIPAMGPAGTVHISVADMLAYLQAHAQADPTFLTTETWARLHTPPQGGDYAMGWGITEQGWLAHNGSNTMWYATAGFVPGTDRAVFMASNLFDKQAIITAMQNGEVAALQD